MRFRMIALALAVTGLLAQGIASPAYAFFGEFPTGFTVPMHWHMNEVLV